MILVDYRQGSAELVKPLSILLPDVEVVETTLDFGDVAFEGKGEGGKPVQIGIEFKKLEELISALKTERLQGHQLLGMQDAYDFKYLLIEGEVIVNKSDRLMKRIGRREFRALPMSYTELMKRVHGLHLRGGLNPLWTDSRRFTVKQIEVLYRTWTDKAFDDHDSHLGIYIAPSLVPISQFRTTVSTLPGIAFRASLSVEQFFKGSLRRAFTAGPGVWSEIPIVGKSGASKRLGASIAAKIEEAIK